MAGPILDPKTFGVDPTATSASPGGVTLDPNKLREAAAGEGNVAKIAAQRGGEGLAISVPSIIDLINNLNPGTALPRAVSGLMGNNPAPLGSSDLGEKARTVYRNLFGYTEPKTATEKVVGNVAEMAGGAVIPAAGEAVIAKSASTAALEASHYLRTLKAMTPKELAATQAAVAGGAGVGKTAGEATSDNPLVQFAATLTGAFSVAGAMRLISMVKTGFGARFSQKGAEVRVGKSLDEMIPEGSQFERNLNEGIASADATGTQPTVATASQSPGAASAEATLQSVPGIAERTAAARAASSDVIRDRLAGELQPPNRQSMSPGDVHETLAAGVQKQISNVEAKASELTGEVNGYVDRAKTSVEQSVAQATRGAQSKEEAGAAIRDVVQRHESAWSEQMDRVYGALPDTKLSSAPLADAVKGVIDESKNSIRTGLVPPPIKNLAERLGVGKELGDEAQALLNQIPESDPRRAAILAQLQGTAPEVSFTELRRWRSDIFAEIRANLDGANPDRQVVRNLSKIADALDATIDQASTISPAYRAANDAFRQGIETFRQGVVEAITRVKPSGEQAVAMEDVAGKFLKGGGQGQVASARDFVNAVGDSAIARNALRDYAVRDFLGSAYDNGVLNTKRATAWLNSHADALDQFPDIRDELSGIMKQGKKLDDVTAFVGGAKSVIDQNAKRSIDEIERSAAAAYTRADPGQAMEAALKGNNPAARMAELTKQMKDDPAAMNGLRRAFFDHMERSVAPNDPMFNNPLMDPKKLRDFMETNAGPMRVLYSPEQINNVKTLARATELSMDTAAAKGYTGAKEAVTPQQAYSAQQVVARLYTMARWTSSGYVVTDFFARKVLSTLGLVEKDQLLRAWERAMFDPAAAKAFIAMGREDFNPQHVAKLLRDVAPTSVNPTAQLSSQMQ